MGRLISKNAVLSLVLERSKLEEEPFSRHFAALSLSKILGKSRKDVVYISISRSGNKVIGAYPTNYNAALGNRYRFYKWAYFNNSLGVNWSKSYDFKNDPYIRFSFEIYFGKW